MALQRKAGVNERDGLCEVSGPQGAVALRRQLGLTL